MIEQIKNQGAGVRVDAWTCMRTPEKRAMRRRAESALRRKLSRVHGSGASERRGRDKERQRSNMYVTM